jgi:dTDP-4-amino-4,6-dideoxygalactose transaminase
MLDTSFSPWPFFSKDEINAVVDILKSNRVNYWTGETCRLFENEFASWTGAQYAVALSNGTLALDASLIALNIGPGDEIIVTPRTFIASVSCVVNVGGNPVFADVDLNSGNISAKTIAPLITSKTKAIICVHLAGHPCDMDPILNLASKHNLYVIEDCAQAHGAKYKGKSVGTIGDIGAWSFCQDKIISTGGEGGMITTNNKDIWSKIWSLKDHGKSFDAVYFNNHPKGFRWLHESFGHNWRMLEMQAAIGLMQLKKISEWQQKRAQNTSEIRDVFLSHCGEKGVIRLPFLRCSSCSKNEFGECVIDNCQTDCVHANYKLYAFVRSENLAVGWSRDRIIEEITKKGVPCFQGTCSEVYLEKAFDSTPWRPSLRLPNAKELGETSLMFLVHPTLMKNEIDLSRRVISEVLTASTRKL